MKMCLGFLLSKAMPGRTAEVKDSFTLHYWGGGKAETRVGEKVEALIRFYVANTDNAASGGEKLEMLHKDFWRSKIDLDWYDNSSDRFERELLPELIPLVEKLKGILAPTNIETVCEIGTGDGRFLSYLREVLQQPIRYIGIDLSADRMDFNRKTYPDTQFVSGDAFEWITSQSSDNTLYVTNGGVLEYFTQRALESLLSHIAREQSGGMLAFFHEPLVPDHDLAKHFSSRLTSAGEYSFSHNYPHLIETAGFAIRHQQEAFEPMGYPPGCRTMTIFAEVKNP